MLITICINNIEYEVKEGEYIFQVCQKLGIFVPHLCYLKGMPPSGRCGLCVVELDEGNIVLSCMTQAKSGMRITTYSEKLNSIRRNNVSKLLKNHKIDCFNCSKSGECTLQIYGDRLNLNECHIENFKGKDNKEISHVKLRDNLIFDKSKCIYCTRCTKFLSEICGIDLMSIELISEIEKTADLIGNIIDICPTAALTQSGSKSEGLLIPTEKIQTFDVSCVYTPKILVSKRDNEIMNISNVESNWIRDETKFIYQKLISRKKTTASYEDIIKKITFEINSKTPEKKIFMLGDNVDILSFFYIKYMSDNLENVYMAIDDHNIPKDIIKNIGLFDEDLSLMDFSIFVGSKTSSQAYYVNSMANNLKGSVSLNLQELSKFIASNENEKLLYSCNFPNMFICSELFKNHNQNKIFESIRKIREEYRDIFNRELNIRTLPSTMAQIYARYADAYIPINELLANYNRHDVKFIFISGDVSYKSSYNDILIIQNSSFCESNQKNDEYLQSTHFLEESGFYINIFGDIIKTEKVLNNDLMSNKEFIFNLMSSIYGQDFPDINEEIKQKITKTFLTKHNS